MTFNLKLEHSISNTIQIKHHIGSIQTVQSQIGVSTNYTDQLAVSANEYSIAEFQIENCSDSSQSIRSHTAVSVNDIDQPTIVEAIENINAEDITMNDAEFADESDDDMNQNIEDFRCLHPNTSCTVYDALLMVHTYSIRHDLPWTAIVDLIKLMNVVIGEDKLPTSIRNIRKTFCLSQV